MAKLSELTRTLRSKNAGVDYITFDFIFKDRATYDRAVEGGWLAPASAARVLGLSPDAIEHHMQIPSMHAVKFSVRRPRPSGSPGEHDIYGAQQCAPFVDLEVT